MRAGYRVAAHHHSVTRCSRGNAMKILVDVDHSLTVHASAERAHLRTRTRDGQRRARRFALAVARACSGFNPRPASRIVECDNSDAVIAERETVSARLA